MHEPGNIFDAPAKAKPKTPPGLALIAAEKKAQTRQDAGKNPSVTPGQLLHGGLHALNELVNPPPTYMVDGKVVHRAAGGPVFTPATLIAQAVATAPQQIRHAHDVAVRVAHPSQNPPSDLDVLLSGALGFPRGAAKFEPKGSTTGGFVPKVPKGKSTPETAGDLGKQVREGLRGATAARREQEKLYSAERTKRAGAASQAMDEHGGVEGYRAALQELKGELPKLQFGGFENFDQAGLDALFNHAQEHPTLRPYEKIRTQTALVNVLNGKVPTRSELALLQQVFGREVSGRIAASVPFWSKAKNLGVGLWNVPRSLMASFDLSAPFRQGLMAGARHPVMFGKNFGPMVKAFGSENVYRGLMDEIASRPSFPKMRDAGLALTDLGEAAQREEQFPTDLAEHIPVVGRGVRASSRAYVGFLNKMRADMFDYYLDSADKQGVDLTPDAQKSVARFINSATGRGDLGALREHAVTLNSLFFSPRLMASRLNFLNPVYYAKLDPFARKQALVAARNLVGAIGATLYLAKLGGATVNADPRNADFAKIKLGDTRIDVAGGFQQYVRLVAQLVDGKIVSSTSGKTLTLGPEGPGKLSRFDIALRFVEQKLAPSPGVIVSWFKGTDFADKPFSWKKTAVQNMVPLLAQDAYGLQTEYHDPALTLGGYGLGAFGFGIQTYGPKQPKQKSGGFDSNVFDGGSGSTPAGNIFDK